MKKTENRSKKTQKAEKKRQLKTGKECFFLKKKKEKSQGETRSVFFHGDNFWESIFTNVNFQK